MNASLYPCVAQASRKAAGGSDSVGDKVPFNKPIIIGITGGMASGKSTLARMVAGRGIAHVDADALVHRLLQHNREVIARIAAAFPNTKHQALGTINRAALAAHITNHPETLSVLEAILHPRVRALEQGAIAFARRNRLRALVLDIPLLYETGADALCDVVIAVHAPMKHRRTRAFKRLGMTEAKWSRLIARQWPDRDRNALADVVIPATMGKAAMRRRIHALMVEWGLL